MDTREIKNGLAIDGVIDKAFRAVMGAREPDAVHALLVGLAHDAVDRAAPEIARLKEHAVTLANTERHAERESCAAFLEAEGRHDMAFAIRHDYHHRAPSNAI